MVNGTKYELKVKAKENLKLPDNPYVYWIKGNTYKVIIDNIGECVTVTSQTVPTYYTMDGWKKFKDLFDIKEVV